MTLTQLHNLKNMGMEIFTNAKSVNELVKPITKRGGEGIIIVYRDVVTIKNDGTITIATEYGKEPYKTWNAKDWKDTYKLSVDILNASVMYNNFNGYIS